jgi:hypothetical protein
VPHFAKIALAQSQQRGAIHLGIAADEIMQPWMERLPVLVEPCFARLIGGIDKDRLRIPIGTSARQIAAAFQQHDRFAFGCQPLRERCATRSAADHDDVGMFYCVDHA